MSTTETGGGCPHLDDYDPTSDEMVADPFPTWQVTRRETPIFFSPALDAYVVTRYTDVNEILMDAETFSSRDALKPPRPNPPEVEGILAAGFEAGKLGAMVMLDAPEHTKIRRATARAFTPRRVALLEQEVQVTADAFIDAMLEAGPPLDFVDAFAYPLPLRIITRLLDVPDSDAGQLHRWANAKMALQGGQIPLEQRMEAARDFVEFQRYVLALVSERKANPGDDLVSAMLELESDEGEPLADVVLVGQVMGLVNAGHETVTSMLAVGLDNLLTDRSQWEALRADPGLAVAATEEALRFDGPLKQVYRRSTRDAEIGGVTIPEGSRVAIVLSSANHDEEVFTDPERFDIGVDHTGQHLAFGRGVHFCVGASLARAEGRIAFETLSQRLPSLRLVSDAPMGFAPHFAVRLPLALHVEWDR